MTQPTVRTTFPHAVRQIDHTWIPLSDGVRLAARLWLPVDADQQPVPAILETIPYRKNDATAARDALHHPYFAGHGYACVRVDLRGSGESDGILHDEYLPQEQDDALEVLRWIAAQPWCTGKVGIIGKSWGGFNGLQIAARRPPELAAIITVCSTDDRYADDVHYIGGGLLASEMLSWASIMLAYNARPPDPLHFGPQWRTTWLDRLERTPPYAETWMGHPQRDAFWKHGSVCEEFAAIVCPVYAVGGWADSYTNAIPRLLAGLRSPRKGLIGPWAHLYPMVGEPGPAIGFLQECLRWWDHWLKRIDTGVMDEAMLCAWIQEGVHPQHAYHERSGRWVGCADWPLANQTEVRLHLNRRTLDATAQPPTRLTVGSVQLHGIDGGAWCAYARPGDLPIDQRADDGRAICFDSEPAEVAVDLLGFPQATLTLSADQPLAVVALRLCDVAPDGASLLVSRGVLNLTHRHGHEQSVLLTPGEVVTVTVTLDVCGHRLAAGHRWRLAVAPTCWPLVWPSPTPVTLTVHTGEASFVTLPVLEVATTVAPPNFGPPEVSPPLPMTVLEPASAQRHHEFEVTSARHTLTVTSNEGRVRFDTNAGLEYASRTVDQYTIVEGDPLSAEARCLRTIEMARGAWCVRIETDSTLRGDAERFYLANALTVFEGETQVFARRWNKEIVRQGV